jgi:hypothetical protein
MPGTQLFRRLWKEGRILAAGHGDNTGAHLNFLPHMDATRLVTGYRLVLQRIYNCDAYYKRVKLYLSRTQPKPGERSSEQRWLTHGNARAFVTSIIRQGVFGRQRWSYWKFLMTVATRYRPSFGAAMTLAVMGYHLEVMTRELLDFGDNRGFSPALEKGLSGNAGGEVRDPICYGP